MQTDGREMSFSTHQLRQAVQIRERIEQLEAQLRVVLGMGIGTAPIQSGPRRRLSLAARRRIAAGQRARWARTNPGDATTFRRAPPSRRLSAARRAKLAAASRARWAKAKAAGRT